MDISLVPHRFWSDLGCVLACVNRNKDIWVFHRNGLNCSLVLDSDQAVIIRMTIRGRDFHLGFVHAGCTGIIRRQLWFDILALGLECLILMGDFNVILGAHERSGIA